MYSEGILKTAAEKVDDDFMLERKAGPVSLNIELEGFYRLVDELKAASCSRIIYDEDPLKMAHETIRQMRLGIERALERLMQIRGEESW